VNILTEGLLRTSKKLIDIIAFFDFGFIVKKQ